MMLWKISCFQSKKPTQKHLSNILYYCNMIHIYQSIQNTSYNESILRFLNDHLNEAVIRSFCCFYNFWNPDRNEKSRKVSLYDAKGVCEHNRN